MQGIILAAGMGKRLKELTANNTKCMIKVNGITLIERMLTQLDQLGLNRIIIVVGYEGKKLQHFIQTLNVMTEIIYVDNPVYDKTNNIYSLGLAKNFLLEDDTLLLESDLIFEDSVLRNLLRDPRETLALVDKYESWMDGTVVKLSAQDDIIAFISGKRFQYHEIKDYFKTVNIYKFSKEFSANYYVPFLEAYTQALGANEYYEQVLRVITMLDDAKIKAKRLNGELWYEIDDVQDLDIASSMFASSEIDKLKLLQKRFGGYWRYPHVKDFCYLVNPYFPPQKLLDEIKASFDTLIQNYPSGMEVNSLLVSKNFNIAQDKILVGNGAAELIKCLLDTTTGNVGFIKPTFDEYLNRYCGGNCIYYDLNDQFSYTAMDLMKFYENKDISMLVIVNPDNPTGNYICYADLLKLAEWTKNRNIKLVLDESFVDFSEEKEATLITEDIINAFSNLVIIKSISKSFGVPGLRLGILASGDSNLIAYLKKIVSIWNINSFGEFYLQIYEKYKNDYSAAIEKFKINRIQMKRSLDNFSCIKVFPSQANFFMIELLDGIKADDFAAKMLSNYNILVKSLKNKLPNGEYIRLAIRSEKDNQIFLRALEEYCKKTEICYEIN